MAQDNDDVKEERPREYVILGPGDLQRAGANDEINFRDLSAILVKRRSLFVGVFVVSLVISMAIAFLMQSVYQASIHFRAPHSSDIEILNVPEFKSDELIDKQYMWPINTPENVFDEFQRNFEDRENLWNFFNEKQLYKAYLKSKQINDADKRYVFESKFLEAIVLHRPEPGKDDPAFAWASLNWSDPKYCAVLLNEYSEHILVNTEKHFIGELNSKLRLEKERVEEQISALRTLEKQIKKNRITELDENIAIARELGFKRSKGLEQQNTNEVSVNVSEDRPLYYEGYEVLEAEKKALIERKDSDPFINGLEYQIMRLEYLNSIKVPVDNIRAAKIIQMAVMPDRTFKPERQLIVLLGSVFGIFLGLLVVFVSHAVEERA